MLTGDVRKNVPGPMLFAEDIVPCGDGETYMTEYLETWRRALEDRGMRISRPKTQFMDLHLDMTIAKEESRLGEELQRVCILSISVQAWRRQEAWQQKLHRVSAVWKNWKRCSGVLCERRMPVKLKGKVYKTVVRPAVVWCSDLGNNERTRSTTRSKGGEYAEMDVQCDKEGSYPK